MNMNKTKLWATILLGLALMVVLMVGLACEPTEEPVPRSYSCNVYTEQGCAKFVVASGGEIEIQSGGTFDLQSGATVDFSGGVDLDGSTLTMDADGDTTLVASQDDVITATITDTTYLVIANGNLKVGNGSPTTSQNGEDAYVEGGFEVDGTARFDGAIDANSTADIAGNISSSSGAITVTDNVMVDGAANAVQLTVQGYTTQTSSLAVFEQSDGTDVATISNAGVLALSSSLDASADVDVGTWLNLSAQSVIALSDGGIITPTGTYQVITSTAEVTTSTSIAIWDGSETGDLLILRNGNAADVINIDGTGGNVECKANVALGASDTLTLIWNGSDWNCLSGYDNS